MPDTDPCKAQHDARKEAFDDFRQAADDLTDAWETLEDEESIFDGSSIATGAAVIGMGLACASNPIGWTVCGLGLLGGGAAVYASEHERRDDIIAARQDLDKANRDFWKAHLAWARALSAAVHCMHHNQLRQPN